MEKQLLRQVIQEKATKDQQVTVKLRGSDSVTATVLSVRRGKGKNGSYFLTLQRSDGTVFEVGTPKNEEVTSITVGADFYGETVDSKPTLPVNLENAVRLKAFFNTFVNAPEKVGTKIQLTSEYPEYNGVFKLVAATKEKGKYGQVCLKLAAENQDYGILVYSHRDSSIVSSASVYPSV